VRAAGRLARRGEGDEQRFARLRREVGRGTGSVGMRELVGVLALADWVLGAGITAAGLENLRRLATWPGPGWLAGTGR